MATIVHISDIHFGWPFDRVVGDAVHRAAEEARPDAIVVSGDLVQRGDFERLFVEAKAFLARFKSPLVVIPGNHDIPLWNPLRRLVAPFARYRRHIAEELDPVLHVPGAVIAGISTPRVWTIDLGFVGRRQLDRVQRAFAAAPPGALRVAVMHHGLVVQKEAGFARHHVRGQQRAIRALGEMEADLVLSGHNHFPRVDVVAPGDGARPFVCAQAGTACSRRYRGPCERNSIAIVRSRARGFAVEVHYFERARDAFVLGETHAFERGGGRVAAPQPAGA
jgi:3',5'-cyclic AMP phosphodiesterase CpdA